MGELQILSSIFSPLIFAVDQQHILHRHCTGNSLVLPFPTTLIMQGSLSTVSYQSAHPLER